MLKHFLPREKMVGDSNIVENFFHFDGSAIKWDFRNTSPHTKDHIQTFSLPDIFSLSHEVN